MPVSPDGGRFASFDWSNSLSYSSVNKKHKYVRALDSHVMDGFLVVTPGGVEGGKVRVLCEGCLDGLFGVRVK